MRRENLRRDALSLALGLCITLLFTTFLNLVLNETGAFIQFCLHNLFPPAPNLHHWNLDMNVYKAVVRCRIPVIEKGIFTSSIAALAGCARIHTTTKKQGNFCNTSRATLETYDGMKL